MIVYIKERLTYFVNYDKEVEDLNLEKTDEAQKTYEQKEDEQ